MKWTLVLTAAGLLGLAGCEFGFDPGVPPSVSVETPAVYDSYYWGGYYDGPYWVYRDGGGRWYHEEREEHDRRFREYHGGGRGEHYDRGYRGGERHGEPHGAEHFYGGEHGGGGHGGGEHGGGEHGGGGHGGGHEEGHR